MILSETVEKTKKCVGTTVAQTSHGGRAATLTKRMRIECILCPTDLSPDSDEALRYAVALSRGYNAESILLHCELKGEAPTKSYASDKAAETIRKALVKYRP